MQPFLAMITPLASGGEPTHPIAPGGPPPHVEHPIPPTVWPRPPGGGKPPGIWPSPGHPAHPIAPGGKPPGIWGGPPNYVDIGGPADQPGPSHPIVLPPGTEKPPPGIWHEPIIPPEIWGGPPLWIWGDPIYPAEPPEIIDWHAGWSAETGWVIVGIPNVPAPTPSKK
jgi:hypothetical protein